MLMRYFQDFLIGDMVDCMDLEIVKMPKHSVNIRRDKRSCAFHV